MGASTDTVKDRTARAIDDDRISTLRELARKAEEIEANDWSLRAKVDAFFTCRRVAIELGCSFADEYATLFGFDENEVELWNDPSCMSRRILALCFMAAMVEAGDA